MLKNSLLAIVVTAITASAVNAASLRSLSREVPVNVNGKTVLEVAVSCSGISKPRVMKRELGSNEWCSVEVEGLCFTRKIRAARKLCAERFDTKEEAVAVIEKPAKPEPKQVTEKKPAKVEPVAKVQEAPKQENDKKATASKQKLGPNGETRAQLMQEYLQVEEKRLALEQKRIELNKRDVELQKRELELK